MEIHHRKSLGILAGTDETYISTVPSHENGSYCHLGMEAPILQCEVPRSKHIVKFFFSIHMIAPSAPNIVTLTDYYICHGDQFFENVFIAAVHEEGTSIPFAFLCVTTDAYLAWMFPKAGEEESTIPQAEAWSMHNATEFCRANIKHEIPVGEKTELTIHIPTVAVFEVKAVAAIEQLAIAKASGEYAYIFDLLFPDDASNETVPQNPKRAPAKAALPLREKLPRGCLLFQPNEPPKIDVNSILGEVTIEAATGQMSKVNSAAKSAAAKKAAAAKAEADKAIKAAAAKTTKAAAAAEKKRKGAPSNLVDLTKTPAVKVPKVAQGPQQQSGDSSVLQPLVSALTAVVSKLAASSPTVMPSTPSVLSQQKAFAPPTRAELREESKFDHTLRQEIRMDELKYIKEMKSIFTEQPISIASTPVAATIPAASTRSAAAAAAASISQTLTNSNQDVDLNEAWRILSNVDSWKHGEEKDAILKDQIGASSQADLSFIDSTDLKVIVGKLKLVQANRLKRALKLI